MYSVEFHDLTFTATQGERKQILKNVSGQFQTGQVSAIMGPSGAGKSSLLNAISGYNMLGVKGTLRTNGEKRNHSEFHKLSCYITQDDVIQPLFNVQEVMMLAANLKLSRHLSKDKKLDIIDGVLSDLGLIKHKTTRVERLSGGQKKRLSIALELVSNPPVFFLDEPLTGLDNVASTQCMRTLKKLAQQGRTIVCTIHTPSNVIFDMLDRIYVLARGQCVYQGAPHGLISFLSSVNMDCPKYYSPSDYIIELTDGNQAQTIMKLSQKCENGRLCFREDGEGPESIHMGPTITSENTKSYQGVSDIFNKIIAFRQKIIYSDDSCTKKLDVSYANPQWHQFLILYKRMFVQTARSHIQLQVSLIHHIICGIIFGTMFYNTGNFGDYWNTVGHMKFSIGITVFITYTNLMVPIMLYTNEGKLAKKEYFNRWYAMPPYYLALIFSRLPAQLFFNLVFLIISYYLMGLPMTLLRLTAFCAIGSGVAMTADSLGLAIGSITNVTNGAILGPCSMGIFLVLAIYGVDFAEDIPWYMNIVMHTSVLRGGFIGFLLSMFQMDRPQLDCGDVFCYFDKPEILMKFLDVEKDTVWNELWMLFLLYVALRMIAYVFLRRRYVVK